MALITIWNRYELQQKKKLYNSHFVFEMWQHGFIKESVMKFIDSRFDQLKLTGVSVLLQGSSGFEKSALIITKLVRG